MKKLTLFMAALGIFGLTNVFAATATPAFAATDLFKEACASGRDDAAGNPETSTLCKDKSSTNNPIVGPDGIILRVSTIIASIAGVVAVIMIIIGGAGMITSGGDANAVKTARSRVYHALIGLVIIILAQTIISLVVGRVLA